MHAIQPARLKPGVTLESLTTGGTADHQRDASRIIRGNALIFWDPKLEGTKFARKLDDDREDDRNY